MPTRAKALLVMLGLLILAVWIVGLFAPAPTLHRDPGPTQLPPPARTSSAARIGSNCQMDRMTPTGVTADYAREIVTAIKNNDNANGAALIQGGQAIVLQEAVSGRILDATWTGDVLKVRVLGGAAGGRELWVHQLLCR